MNLCDGIGNEVERHLTRGSRGEAVGGKLRKAEDEVFLGACEDSDVVDWQREARIVKRVAELQHGTYGVLVILVQLDEIGLRFLD